MDIFSYHEDLCCSDMASFPPRDVLPFDANPRVTSSGGPLSMPYSSNDNDNDSVATGATFLIISNPDGSRTCLKHPTIRFNNDMTTCPSCDKEYSDYQTLLQQKKDSLELQLNQLENRNQQQRQQQIQQQSHQRQDETGSSTSQNRNNVQNAPSPTALAPSPSSSSQYRNYTGMSGMPGMSGVPGFSQSSSGAGAPGSNSMGTPSGTGTTAGTTPGSLGAGGPMGMGAPMQSPYSSYPGPAGNNPMYSQMQGQFPMHDAYAMQMQRMQQMQDWMLYQKEQEVQMLRKKVEEQQEELHNKSIHVALLEERLRQQEERMQHELKLLWAVTNNNKKQNHKKSKEKGRGDNGSPESQSQQQQQQQHLSVPGYPVSEASTELHKQPGSAKTATVSAPKDSTTGGGTSQYVAEISEQLANTEITGDKKIPPAPAPARAFDNEDKFIRQTSGRNEDDDDISAYQLEVPSDIDVDDLGPPTVPLQEEITLFSQTQVTRKNASWIASNGGDRFNPRVVPKKNGSKAEGQTENEEGKVGQQGRLYPVVSDTENEDQHQNDLSFMPSDQSLTVASSTYGEDRQIVVDKNLLDPYGDEGLYNGMILKSTGMPHGKGKMIYDEDKRVYEGEWRHGRWHGFGRAFFANGDSYEGEYRFDQRHGRGKYCWSDGRVYDGMFMEDKRHGQGIFKWPDGAIYEGEFSNGQREGHGSYKFSDGGQYTGDWKDGRYNGYGTCTWEDGRCYQGEWKNGMAHGRGIETYADGTVRHDGQWLSDEPVRD